LLLTTLLSSDAFTVSLVYKTGYFSAVGGKFIILAHRTDQSGGSVYREGSIPIGGTLECIPALAVIVIIKLVVYMLKRRFFILGYSGDK
jgi:hypothetical protein